MIFVSYIRQYFRFGYPYECGLSWIVILAFLLVVGMSGACFPAEPADSSALKESDAVETEKISPDYALERSEQKFLRYSGKRIGSIRIKRLEVFDSSLEDTTGVETAWYEKIVNSINFDTRETTIRQSLLFREGDRIDPYVLADSERLLRYLDFIKDVLIVVIPDEVDTDSASILVIVKDQWSLVVSGRKQGNGFQLGMTEGNILGYGHQVSGELTSIPHYNPRFGVSYSVQNIHGSFITGKLNYLKVPENHTEGLVFSRELVSPVLKYSGGLELRKTSIKIKDSLPYFADNTSNLVDLWIGKTIRFKPITEKDIERRRSLVISGRFRKVLFTTHPDITDSTWFRYHDVSYFLGNIAFIQHRYYQTNLLYNFGRAENIPYGYRANLTSGMIDDGFRRRWYLSTTLAAGSRIEGLGYGAGKLSFSGCPEGGTFELGILKLQSLYFTDIMNLGNFRFRQFLKTEYSTGIHRFSDDTIDFTREQSIRGVGYNHRVTGAQRLFMSLDTVAFTPWRVHGFTFAFFSFAEVDIIGPNNKSVFTQNYYSGLGLGVRIHSERIGIETVQVRFAWYPNLPAESNAYAFTSFGEKRILPIDFVGSKPEILEY